MEKKKDRNKNLSTTLMYECQKNIYTLRNNQQLEIQARFVSSKERWRNKKKLKCDVKTIIKNREGAKSLENKIRCSLRENADNVDDSEAKKRRGVGRTDKIQIKIRKTNLEEEARINKKVKLVEIKW